MILLGFRLGIFHLQYLDRQSFDEMFFVFEYALNFEGVLRNLCFLHSKLILVSRVADTLFSTNVIVLRNAKSSDCLLFHKVFKEQNKM